MLKPFAPKQEIVKTWTSTHRSLTFKANKRRQTSKRAFHEADRTQNIERGIWPMRKLEKQNKVKRESLREAEELNREADK